MKSKKALVVMGVLLASCMGAALVACTNDKDPEQPKGKEYTVTFDANGGTLTGNSTIKVAEGQKITGAPTAEKANHTFEAWYDAAEDGVKITLTTYTVSADVTLYAHYTPESATSDVKITFDANGGAFDGGASTMQKTPDEDKVIVDIDDPAKDNHRFLGWFTAAEGGDEVNPMFDEFTESQTLYAHWVLQYTVTFNGCGGTLDGSATVKVDTGTTIKGAPTASKPGNDFYGWFTAAEGGDEIDLNTYTVTGDISLHAHYGVYSMPLKVLKDSTGATAVGYRIEAENSKISGEPSSENNANPGTHTENVETASGGHSIGYLGTAGKTITFTFNSAAAGKANMSIRATSNNTQMDFSAGFTMWVDDQTVTTADFTVKFNGAAVNFEPASLRGAGIDQPMTWNLYWDPIPLGELDVVEGLNSLEITVAKTTVPNMDCLDIETELALTAANGDAASGEATLPAPPAPEVEYEKDVSVKLIVGGYAGGPAVQKAVLGFTDDITPATLATNPFSVSLGAVLGSKDDKVYISDENGNKLADTATSSRYVTVEYKVSFGQWGANGNLNPFNYNQQTGRNTWKDVTTTGLAIKGLTIGETTYTKFTGSVTATKETPCIEEWDTTGTYTDGEGEGAITLKYASYTPEAEGKTANKPLIVWLHGAGEGGVDPSITILGNQVSNLSKNLIQKYFVTDTCAGAYVLAPQAPTMWMDNGSGQQGGSNVGESIYTEALFNLIKNYVDTHSDIDANRVYIGGCSNGGWMTVEMLSKHGEYFAAAFPIAVPFDKSAGLTEAEFAKLVNVPMWITHAQNDNTVAINEINTDYTQWPMVTTTIGAAKDANSNQLYIELLKAGATKVYYSLFENVTVESGDDAASYDGHYSWVYTLRDECSKVQAKTGTGENGAFTLADLSKDSNATVTLTEGGEAVTLWGWIAAQAKAAA